MDYQLKGVILNFTLKSDQTTPIERANVLRVTMDFYRGTDNKSPGKWRRDRLGKHRSLTCLGKIPFWYHFLFLGLKLLFSPVSDPDAVTVNSMHLVMQRLEAVQYEVHQLQIHAKLI